MKQRSGSQLTAWAFVCATLLALSHAVGAAAVIAAAAIGLPPSPSQAAPTPPLAPLSLETILQTQNVCAGLVPPGWIKINDAWNPTVCGSPARIAYNVWTIQRVDDQPMGAVIHGCRGAVPSGWAIVGTLWNPTVCGHPSTNQPNVMAIKRLN
ncbi:MAG TPA: hypothetical protein VE058_01365 [Steroidobacteraceae bacterium]|nr:hypothetical protein [Steroidobacteraceae bacterium]